MHLEHSLDCSFLDFSSDDSADESPTSSQDDEPLDALVLSTRTRKTAKARRHRRTQYHNEFTKHSDRLRQRSSDTTSLLTLSDIDLPLRHEEFWWELEEAEILVGVRTSFSSSKARLSASPSSVSRASLLRASQQSVTSQQVASSQHSETYQDSEVSQHSEGETLLDMSLSDLEANLLKLDHPFEEGAVALSLQKQLSSEVSEQKKYEPLEAPSSAFLAAVSAREQSALRRQSLPITRIHPFANFTKIMSSLSALNQPEAEMGERYSSDLFSFSSLSPVDGLEALKKLKFNHSEIELPIAISVTPLKEVEKNEVSNPHSRKLKKKASSHRLDRSKPLNHKNLVLKFDQNRAGTLVDRKEGKENRRRSFYGYKS